MMNRIQAVLPTAAPTDGELLARFAAGPDDAAFAELVARHGPMVYGVCLRRLGQCQDAEDCFQAVFLALARQAVGLLDRPNLGPWLYTVARRVSGKALRSRRRRRWVFWGKTPEPECKPLAEVDVDLDAALASLSEPERSAVVLCHLEGLSRAEAAKALAVPEGTLSARLARALEKLRRKLRKQPLAVLAAAAVVLLPERLPASTAVLVRHLRSGALEEWASPRVLDLYRKALPMRLLNRLGPAVAALAAAGLIMLGAFAGWALLSAQPPAETKPSPPAAGDRHAQKKSFAAAIEELQGKPPELPKRSELVELTISKPAQAGMSYSMTASETLAGGRVDHRIESWRGLQPLLEQMAEGGRSIRVTIQGKASRLDANWLVAVCKHAGYRWLIYQGPKLFSGRDGEPRNAFDVDGDKGDSFSVELATVPTELPGIANWTVRGETVEPREKGASTGNDPFTESIKFGFATKGVETDSKEDHDVNAADSAFPMARGGRGSDESRRDSGAKRVIRLAPEQQGEPSLVLYHDSILSMTATSRSFAPLVERAARHAKTGRFDVLVGVPDLDALASPRDNLVNPLHINQVFNALKRGGAAEIQYRGPRLFTGEGPQANGADVTLAEAQALVRLNLRPNEIDGFLPDETNGWRATPHGYHPRGGVKTPGTKATMKNDVPLLDEAPPSFRIERVPPIGLTR